MTQVELSKIIIDEKRQDQIIVLKEKEGNRQFPIVIGIQEAASIKMRLSGRKPPRPMTHDLLLSILKELGSRVERVIIDDLIDNTFHAKIVVRNHAGEERVVDCRPSDGIAVAVRAQAPVFVEEVVFKKATVFKLEM